MPEVRGEVADTTKLNERCGEESAQTNVHNQSTLDDLDDHTGDNAIGFLNLLNVAPRTLILCALLGENQSTLFVLFLEDKSLNRVTDGHNL